MRQIKIVSDGTAGKTFVYDVDGKPIQGVAAISVNVCAGGLAIAQLTFENVILEMSAETGTSEDDRDDGTPL